MTVYLWHGTHAKTLDDFATDKERWIAIRQRYYKDLLAGFCGAEYDKLVSDRRVHKFEIFPEGLMRLTTIVSPYIFHNRERRRVLLSLTQVDVTLTNALLDKYVSTDLLATYYVRSKVSGRRDGVLPHYYHFPNDGTSHLGFCFGVRGKPYVDGLISTGEFYQFFVSVLNSLWYINPNDRAACFYDYRRILDDGTLEAVQKGG